MNSTHRVNVVKVKELRKHPNADSLSLVDIDGYQVVVRTEEFDTSKLYAYIQPDSVVPAREPYKFLWNDREFTGEVPERYRRITVRRFRKEYSEGLLLPLIEILEDANAMYNAKEGDDIANLVGITHYEEMDPTYVLGTQGRKLTLWQRILKLFGHAPKPFGPKDGPGVYDVESIKNYPRVLVEGEAVLATEKIHGSNARYYFDGKQFWVGSHKKWWKDKTNIWWRVAEKNPWIEEFCRANPKHTLRGEVTPTQPGYQYGNTPEEQFFAFDVQLPDGSYVDKVAMYRDPVYISNGAAVFKTVPVVYAGPYNAAKLKARAEGKSLVQDANHIREGIVISSATERTVRGVGRAQLKLKSMKFLEKENA
jgi:tRNA-binding EMAP/Myf-like protein